MYLFMLANILAIGSWVISGWTIGMEGEALAHTFVTFAMGVTKTGSVNAR